MPAVRRTGAFPDMGLHDLSGVERPLSEAWRGGLALVLIGHKGYKTTRETLPYVDRIHRRRAPQHGVLAVLQDEPQDAAELKRSLDLELPLLLEPDPYPLAEALDLVAVPTLFLVGGDGAIVRVSEAFSRADLDAFAGLLGVAGPLFEPDDRMPAIKPG